MMGFRGRLLAVGAANGPRAREFVELFAMKHVCCVDLENDDDYVRMNSAETAVSSPLTPIYPGLFGVRDKFRGRCLRRRPHGGKGDCRTSLN